VSKFAPRSTPGLFVGWALLPAGKFKGDYYVISIEDMKRLLNKPSNARTFVQRVKEIYRDETEDYIFPLKALYDKQRRTITNVSGETPNVEESLAETLTKNSADDWLINEPPPKNESSPVPEGDVVISSEVLPGVPRFQEGGSSSSNSSAHPPPIPEDRPSAKTSMPIPSSSDLPEPGGRKVRKYGGTRGSTRPPHIWPEMWTLLSKKQKLKEIDDYSKLVESGQAPPASPVVFSTEDIEDSTKIETLLKEVACEHQS